MDCADELSTAEYWRQFHQKAFQQRIPLSGVIELTQRCNLRCVHCYLGHCPTPNELSTQEWLTILDEITAAGCLSLLMTGGEPLLRKDFAEIYRHACQNGLLVTVFTNGTRVAAQHIELFQEFPPRQVDITLYGATAATYERITGIPGSYQDCIAGIERLLAGGIRVGLKTVLMTLNRQEFFDIERIAADYGVKFRFDVAINACLNGDLSPLEFRVPAEEAVEVEFSIAGRREAWSSLAERMKAKILPETLYICGAGITSFGINAAGELRPCLMITTGQYNLQHGNFEEDWTELYSPLRMKKLSENKQCSCCNKQAMCGYCPAYFALETGSEQIASEYLCALGQYRMQKIYPVAQ